VFAVDSRERLIEATAELLRRDGYSAMSPAAIQKRAEVGQGSMYHHFAGKPELAAVALDRNAQVLLAAAEAALSGPGTPIERVLAYLERERDPLLGCPVGRLAQDREVVADERLRAPVGDVFAVLEQRIATVLGEAHTITAPSAVAAAVVAVVQGGYVLARAANDRAPFDRAVAGAVHLLTVADRGAST
jgi:AcrR family transcriptional regulator